tara:strand:- start:189 stop:473 length:285 start_codon:yes stop_codon:yes gene_type:complete
MDKKYLDKVIDQLVSETTIDYEYMGGIIFTPFLPPSFSKSSSLTFFFSAFLKSFSSYFTHFSEHCESVYGLNKEETKYVWNEYRGTIKDKINNG